MGGEEHPQIPIGAIVNGFKIIRHIGSGGFGEIYTVREQKSQTFYAMKIEFLKTAKQSLDLEIKILNELGDSPYFPKLIAHGKYNNIRYYVMELLGASLQGMRHIAPGRRFSMYTVLKIALESLITIEEFHKHGYIHRDIKPGNFLIRYNDKRPICLIDFGLCRKYLDEKGNHVPPRDDPGFTGTCRYASVHAHNYSELSRRDDLISWVYTIVELADAHLPWPGTKDREKTKQIKKTITATSLLRSFPDEFLDIYRQIRALHYEDTPDYEAYKKLISDAISDIKPRKKGFDWEYYSKKTVEDVSPITLNEEKQPSEHSLVSTKAVQGPPPKPFTIPTVTPPSFQPPPPPQPDAHPIYEKDEPGCTCRIV